jgi:antitoxin component YwqK of YwqJK toxin-antitoxin module
MRFIQLITGIVLSIPLNAQYSSRYDTLSRSYCIYDSTRLVEREELGNFIGYRSTTTYYFRDGTKKMKYTQDYNDRMEFVDTLFEWSTTGNMKYMEIYSDSGHLELSFDTTTGSILSRGEFTIGSHDTIVQLFPGGFKGFHSAFCDSHCVRPFGKWYTFHSNGFLESEGSYLPYQMMMHDSASTLAYDDQNGEKYVLVIVAWETKVRNGHWLFYNKRGDLIREEFYERGILQSVIEH